MITLYYGPKYNIIIVGQPQMGHTDTRYAMWIKGGHCDSELWLTAPQARAVLGVLTRFWSPLQPCLAIVHRQRLNLLLLLCFIWSDPPAELGARAHTLNVIYPFITSMVFIGVSQFTLHLLLMTIGAHDFLGTLLLNCDIFDFRPPTYQYLHFELEQNGNNIIFQ